MSPTETAGRGSLRASLSLIGSRRFGTFWLGSFFSNVGTWMQLVAEPWLVLSMSGSPVLLGLDAFALDAPNWVLTLFGGYLADHSDRRRVIFLFQGIQFLCPVLLVLLMLSGWLQVWMIIALSLVVGITDALSMPAYASIVPLIVEREQIGNAIALNSTQFNLSRILGPAFAGVIMARHGALGCFVMNALSYVPLLLAIFWIRLPARPSPAREVRAEMKTPPWWSEVHTIGRNRELRGTLLAVLASSLLCGPLVAFCPVLVKDVLHLDASHFGGAVAAFGLGGLLGALGNLALVGRMARQKLRLAGAILFGASVVGAGLAPSLSVLVVALVVAGFSLTFSNTMANAILQTTAHDGIRGQTASLFMLSMRGGLSLGSLLTGLSVAAAGARTALVINGGLAIVAQLALYYRALARPRLAAAAK